MTLFYGARVYANERAAKTLSILVSYGLWTMDYCDPWAHSSCPSISIYIFILCIAGRSRRSHGWCSSRGFKIRYTSEYNIRHCLGRLTYAGLPAGHLKPTVKVGFRSCSCVLYTIQLVMQCAMLVTLSSSRQLTEIDLPLSFNNSAHIVPIRDYGYIVWISLISTLLSSSFGLRVCRRWRLHWTSKPAAARTPTPTPTPLIHSSHQSATPLSKHRGQVLAWPTTLIQWLTKHNG